MREYEFRTELWLPRQREEVFNFFSDARNLQAITPEWLHFQIATPEPVKIHDGAVIDYKLRVRGFPMRWRTLISAWEPPVRFVDEQAKGPYRLWIHEHTFEEQDGGTLIKDYVRYAVFMGWLVVPLFVRRDVEKIFAFRKVRLLERFGKPTAN
ncbi:MAG: SRPBCC family protein [Limisphaerales bacterium]